MLNKKGVSPVIAVVMLLLIVVVMVGGVFVWMQTMQEDIEGAGQEQMKEFIEQAGQEITIESHSCDEDDNITSVSLYNGHDDTWEDVAMYINGGFVVEFDMEPGRETLDLESPGTDISTALSEQDPVSGDTLSLTWGGDTVASRNLGC